MCKLIADLAGTDKQILKQMIYRLEQSSGMPNVDVRLTSEIYGKLHIKLRELGLDPNDTTPHELYAALLNLACLHDQFLAKRFGIEDSYNPAVVLPAVVQVINKMNLPKQAWGLKPATIKRLLKAVPPRQLMKQLRYRSVDSLLKREYAPALLAVARTTETTLWKNRFLQTYKKLQARDFESRPVEVLYQNSAAWHALGNALAHSHHNTVMHAPESATVVVLPMSANHLQGLTLASTLTILHSVADIRMHSTYFKFHHLQTGFGALLYETFQNLNADHVRLAGQPIHWRIVQRYYGNAHTQNHPEIFNPHVQPEDLAWRKAEALLYRLEPALHFWYDLDFVGLPQTHGPLSFNLADVALNAVNKLPFEQRIFSHLQAGIWDELYCRYLGQASLERQVVQQLGDQHISNAFVPASLEFAW